MVNGAIVVSVVVESNYVSSMLVVMLAVVCTFVPSTHQIPELVSPSTIRFWLLYLSLLKIV